MAEPTWGPRLESLAARVAGDLAEGMVVPAVADWLGDENATWEEMLRLCLLGRWPDWQAAGSHALLRSWLEPRFPMWAQALQLAAAEEWAAYGTQLALALRLPASEEGLRKSPWIVTKAAVIGTSPDTRLRYPLLAPEQIGASFLQAGIGQRMAVKGMRETVPGPCAAADLLMPDGSGNRGWLVMRGSPCRRLWEDVRVGGAGEGLSLRLDVLSSWRPPQEGSTLFRAKGDPPGLLSLDSDFLAPDGCERIALAVGVEGHAIKAMPMPLFQMGRPVWATGLGYLAPVPQREGEEPFGYVIGEPDETGRARVQVTGWPNVQVPVEARIADCYR